MRLIYLLAFITTCALLLVGFYVQYVDGILPCPLCILQRFCYGLAGISFLIGAFTHTHFLGRLFANGSAIIFSTLGMIFAGRQVWLQHFTTDHTNECGASLEYMMQVLPFTDIVKKIFAGTPDCAARTWSFLSIDMAEWSFLCFVGFFLLSTYLALKKNHRFY